MVGGGVTLTIFVDDANDNVAVDVKTLLFSELTCGIHTRSY